MNVSSAGLLEIDLAGTAAAPAQARRALLPLLATVDDDWSDVITLLVSELVTNAVLHTQGRVAVRVSVEGVDVRVEVADSSPASPSLRRYGPMSTTGRGLRLLDHWSSRWGVEMVAPGKVVWFEIVALGLPAAAGPTRDDEP